MQATALVCDQLMQFSIQPVLLPELEPDDVLVKTVYSGVSIGTEFALIRNKISWGPFPIVTGYMGTGIVESVGEAVWGVKPGDKVYVRGNGKISLTDGTSVSPASGTHCSHVITKVGGTHGLDILPKGVSMETASMFVMPAVGFHGVDMAEPKMGQCVVVHGSGLIGLGVIGAAALRGCHVIAVDVQDRQLEMAKAFGASVLIHSDQEDVQVAVEAASPGGADVVFECTGIPAMVDKAIALCRERGKFVWQGNYGEAPIHYSPMIAHVKQLQTFYPCDDGYIPCRRTVLKHMARGILPWEKTITHHIEAADAPKMYEQINHGDKDVVGVTLHWS